MNQPETTPKICQPRRPPSHFFGRDAYVDKIVSTVEICHKASRPACLVIRGYGGIGKTSVALAVCHDVAVRKLFGENRFFVECETAETPALLLQEIASRLGIDLSQGDAHALVVKGLNIMSITQPLLLVLDNAETFLYSTHAHAKEIDTILSEISSMVNVTLILTKRGPEQPLAVQWDSLQELDVLSLEAARQIFHSIRSATVTNHDLARLDKLLDAVDYVPLAVRLLAQVAQSGNESLEQLHKRWSGRKTDLLRLRGRPDHRETSVDAQLRSLCSHC
jgi:predicted ATPase